MFSVLFWTQYRHWPWTHTVFFVLHSIVMLMKQHSYSFYNGHLSELHKTRKSLQKTLKSLEDKVPTQSPSSTTPAARSLSIDYLKSKPTEADINQRRRESLHNEVGNSEIHQVVSTIQSGNPLDLEQIQTFERMIKWEIDALSQDLKGKASTSGKSYSNNLTLKNHFEFIVLPTLVYELEYPRTDTIDWLYVLEKALATAGILFIMQLVAQTFIYPVVMQTVDMKNAGLSISQRLERFPWILGDLIFPFMMEYMMTW
jgi:sterol O-acyltransferase